MVIGFHLLTLSISLGCSLTLSSIWELFLSYFWHYIPTNVEYVGPLNAERAAYLGNARAIIAPSHYIEPFCGTVVEAALCGTPAITSSFGAFTETVAQDRTGFRCQTIRQYLDAIDAVAALNRKDVRETDEKDNTLEVYSFITEAEAENFIDNWVKGL